MIEPWIRCVEDADADTRLDKWLSVQIPDLSRSRAKKLIDDGRVHVNAAVAIARHRLTVGDTVEIASELGLESLLARNSSLKPAPLELQILHEDEDIIVLDKPAGLVVHPGAGTEATTLVEGLLHHLGCLPGGGGGTEDDSHLRPGIVHRLDKDTSGTIVCAKTEQALTHLAKQFAEKTNLREYWALTGGSFEPESVVVESYLHRDPSYRTRYKSLPVSDYQQAEKRGSPLVGHRFARSRFFVQERLGPKATLLRVVLDTGRTHQIRVHCRDIGCPIIGDLVYGRRMRLPLEYGSDLIQRVESAPRQMLHAHTLGITHPRTGEKMIFVSELPDDFRSILEPLTFFVSQEPV